MKAYISVFSSMLISQDLKSSNQIRLKIPMLKKML